MMPCRSCREKMVAEPFHDTVDDHGALQFGAWRWASWCRACGSLVDNRDSTIVPSTDLEEPVPAMPIGMSETALPGRFIMF